MQTALCHDGILPETGISSSNIKDDEIEFYFDETAPNAVLAIDDVHTAESITGTLFAEDNLDSELCAVCRDENVKIGKFENGAFSVTVSKNTEIEVTDDAGNTKVIELLITGIDTEPPTAELSVSENKTGGRRDAEATLRVYGMVQPFALAENIGGTDENLDDEYETEVSDTVSVGQQMFALIPADKYSGGKIDDKYFKENLSDDIFFEVREIRSDRAVYEGESNNTYSVKAVGADGEWYLGVRAMDSLGNTADIVFDDLPLEDAYFEVTDEIFGYTKLIYRLVQMYNDDGTYSNSTERTLFVRTFDESNYAGDTSEKIIVVPNVDNTLPNVEWTVSSQVLEKSFNDDGMPVYKENPTPGSVTFTFTAQDAESGIAKTIVLAYNEETANGDVWRTIEAEPDEDGYWCRDGADYEMFLEYE